MIFKKVSWKNFLIRIIKGGSILAASWGLDKFWLVEVKMAILDEGNRVFRDLNMGNYESLEKIIQ